MTRAIALFERPFYFLRHGETETNAQGLVAGSTDVKLTPLGCKQALEAAAALAGRSITHIYSSPLRRARETAEPIAQTLKLPIAIIPELAERGWGVLEGQPRALRVRGITPPGAETPAQFTERVLKGFASVEGEVPLIVAHSGVFRMLCRTLNIVEPEVPITNALPLNFVPLPQGDWKIEPV